jgi:hypothetical protein
MASVPHEEASGARIEEGAIVVDALTEGSYSLIVAGLPEIKIFVVGDGGCTCDHIYLYI